MYLCVEIGDNAFQSYDMGQHMFRIVSRQFTFLIQTSQYDVSIAFCIYAVRSAHIKCCYSLKLSFYCQ